MPTLTLLEAVAVTAELCGRTFSEPAARVFVADLAAYPEGAVLKALTRCRKEVRGALTVADVVQRIDDGRPGPDEAWAQLPKNEGDSAVWSAEMSEAFAIASPLLADGDAIAARMAFREAYKRLCEAARDAGQPVQWTPTLGHDPRGRVAAVERAVQLGRLSAATAQALLPAPSAPVPHELRTLLPHRPGASDDASQLREIFARAV